MGDLVIYEPKGQAGEYATLATNPYRGCGHACRYCYVPRVLHMPRAEFDAGAEPRPGFIDRLIKDARKLRSAGMVSQVMLSFTTDPYHGGDTALTRQVLEVLRAEGFGFCTLTKGGTRALRDLDLFRFNRDAFASTLTTLDPDFAAKWEPRAAAPSDRIEALRAFYRAGIFTWISLEPVLDIDASLSIIEATHEFVDLYKVGRANYLPQTKDIDWKSYTVSVLERLQQLRAAHYIKRDLQPYLPSDYPNRMRVNQYHVLNHREA